MSKDSGGITPFPNHILGIYLIPLPEQGVAVWVRWHKKSPTRKKPFTAQYIADSVRGWIVFDLRVNYRKQIGASKLHEPPSLGKANEASDIQFFTGDVQGESDAFLRVPLPPFLSHDPWTFNQIVYDAAKETAKIYKGRVLSYIEMDSTSLPILPDAP